MFPFRSWGPVAGRITFTRVMRPRRKNGSRRFRRVSSSDASVRGTATKGENMTISGKLILIIYFRRNSVMKPKLVLLRWWWFFVDVDVGWGDIKRTFWNGKYFSYKYFQSDFQNHSTMQNIRIKRRVRWDGREGVTFLSYYPLSSPCGTIYSSVSFARCMLKKQNMIAEKERKHFQCLCNIIELPCTNLKHATVVIGKGSEEILPTSVWVVFEFMFCFKRWSERERGKNADWYFIVMESDRMRIYLLYNAIQSRCAVVGFRKISSFLHAFPIYYVVA